MELEGIFILKSGVKLTHTICVNAETPSIDFLNKKMKEAMTGENAIFSFGTLTLKGTEIAAADIFKN